MDSSRVLSILVCLYFCTGCHGSSSDILVTFQKAPSALTSSTSATFAFDVSWGNGAGSCANCSIKCKIDDQSTTDCKEKIVSYSNLGHGEHKFEICINRSEQGSCSSYTWSVDTVHPTASISASTSFTSALNLPVVVTFNKPCLGGGGFTCSSINACDLLVYGPAQVIPTTLEVLQTDTKFSILVSFYPNVQYGRVILAMRRGFCTDVAGNRFLRTSNSTYHLHFDRRKVYANLTAHVTTKLFQLNAKTRMVDVSNNSSNLKIYLNFSAPVLNSSAEILSALHISTGVLVPISGKSHGGRRFRFKVNNISAIAVVTITLQRHAIVSRQGTSVSPTEPFTFLCDSQRPTVRLTTASNARTKDKRLPVLIKFSEPVFDFNASAVSVSGGHLLRFNIISWSLYSIDIHADASIMRVEIPESITGDVAGNKNLASNLLQVMHCLYSFGAFSKPLPPHISDPSRNLIRTACHIQVFALSKFLPVSLPVEYYELVRGLQWSIPYLILPWETEHNNSELTSVVMPLTKLCERRLQSLPNIKSNSMKAGALAKRLSPMEYASLFERQNMIPEAEYFMGGRTSLGWKEFRRNMFWLAVIGGCLMLLHASMLFILKLKRRNLKVKFKSYGAVVPPRFEFFLIILSLPCICQAAVSLIKGGSALGTIVSALLLGFSSLCALSMLLFVTVGITMGKLLQYKEIHQEDENLHWLQKPLRAVLGPSKHGQWTWKNKPDSVQLAMLGPFFEDMRGPPRYMISQIGRETSSQGEQIIASDDETEEVEAPFTQKLFGILRTYYLLLESIRRISFGIIAGAYSSHTACKFPVFFIFCITIFQLLFIVLKKPFIQKMVQFVEVVTVTTEAGVFAACIILLDRNSTVANDGLLGTFMIVTFAIGFISQMINEWHALRKQVLGLSVDGRSFSNGLKAVYTGWLLILIPWKLLAKWDSTLFTNHRNGENEGAGSCHQMKIPEIAVSGGTPVRESGSPSSLEQPWMKQLREMARASFSREGNAQASPSTSGYRRNLRSHCSTEAYRDLEAVFSTSR
ncbi:uncharacterized protein LOC116264164 isoform X2 [Nymphaea colorata]|uniref:uncharacterized protein LOC116264164 isoform X2 n=1 Tax=Nymphaea colorata TaxID=210225 RepID=UPI00129DBCE2|nr:uncharacterized protein LOC116264164 isoform X2 [Nymphaea colorata]